MRALSATLNDAQGSALSVCSCSPASVLFLQLKRMAPVLFKSRIAAFAIAIFGIFDSMRRQAARHSGAVARLGPAARVLAPVARQGPIARRVARDKRLWRPKASHASMQGNPEGTKAASAGGRSRRLPAGGSRCCCRARELFAAQTNRGGDDCSPMSRVMVPMFPAARRWRLRHASVLYEVRVHARVPPHRYASRRPRSCCRVLWRHPANASARSESFLASLASAAAGTCDRRAISEPGM